MQPDWADDASKRKFVQRIRVSPLYMLNRMFMYQARTTLFSAVILFIVCTFHSPAQLPPLIPFYAGGQWGFSDSTGKMLVPPRYDTVMVYRDGFAITGMVLDSCPAYNRKIPCTLHGIVESTGRELFEPQFLQEPRLVNELNILIRLDDNNQQVLGLVDNTGKVVVPFEYMRLKQMNDKLWRLEKQDRSTADIYDHSTGEIRPGSPLFDRFVERRDNYTVINSTTGLGAINANGELLVDTVYREIEGPQQDLFLVGHFRNHFVYWGCTDLNGNLIVPAEYNKIQPLTRNLILAIDELGQGEHQYWLYHRDGRRLNDAPFQEVDTLGYNRFLATRIRGVHSIDPAGDTHKLSRWEDEDWRGFAGNHRTNPFFVNGAAAYKHAHGVGYMNMRGEDLLKPEMGDDLIGFILESAFPNLEFQGWPSQEVERKIASRVDEIAGFNEGWAVFYRDEQCGLINADGKELYYGQFDEITLVRNGCAIATDYDYYPERFVYLDTTGKAITDIKKTDYSKCYPFKENRALVQEKRSYGFINRNGKEVIKLQYHSAQQFNNGFAQVASSGWGAIDTSGKVVIPLQYDELDTIIDGFAAAKRDGKWTFVRVNAGELFPPRYSQAGVMRHGLGPVKFDTDSVGCVDTTGKLILTVPGQVANVVGKGLISVDEERLFKPNGEEILAGRFDALRWVDDDILAARSNGSWGFVDMSGNKLSEQSYEDIEPPGRQMENTEIVAAVKRGAWTFVKRDLAEIGAPMYRSFERMDSSYFAAYLSDEQLMYDGNGQLVRAFYDSTISGSVNHGILWQVRHEDKVGFTDTNGLLVIPIIYDARTDGMRRFNSARTNSFYDNGLALVSLDSNALIIDIGGNTVLQDNDQLTIDLKYDGTVYLNDKDGEGYVNGNRMYDPFSGTASNERFLFTDLFYDRQYGKAQSAGNKLYGVIDSSGRYVIAPQFQRVGNIENGYFILQDSTGKWGVMDSTGRICAEFKYDKFGMPFTLEGQCYRGFIGDKTFLVSVDRPPLDISGYNKFSKMEGGLIFVGTDNGCGIIDKSGNIVVPIKWDSLSEISPGLFYVRMADGLQVPHDIHGRMYMQE